MQLGCCAEIRSGLVLSRKQAREKTENRYSLLTLKSVKPDSTVSEKDLDVFDAIELLNKDYLTAIGDVVVRTSTPYTAILIDEKTADMVVSSNFVIIRCCNDILLPEYLFLAFEYRGCKKRYFQK